jgi:heme exporter protein A
MADFTGTGLACIRGERTVFQGLNFKLLDGALIELRGANGSGKSSLLRMMAGLIRPVDGRIAWDETPIDAAPDAHRARVAYIGHLDAVKGALTVRENLAFWTGLRGNGPADVDTALAAFRIADLADVPARHLSAGQRRRAALARLVACPAPLWLLDEPATALDAQAHAALDHAMAAHLGAGGMVVMATHEPDRRATQQLDLDKT